MTKLRPLVFMSLCLSFVIAASSLTALAAKPIIFVSILPQKYFVEQIAGDAVDVEVMVAPGASPATYEPRPRQMAMLAKADAYLAIGVPFEKTWLPRFAGANPTLHIVSIDSGLRKLPMASSAMAAEQLAHIAHTDSSKSAHHDEAMHAAEAHGDHHHEGALDPHVWLSPRWVKAMTKPMRLALTKVVPEQAKQFRINTRNFTKRLDQLDEEIELLYRNIPKEKRIFMTFHPSWGYYAMTYNLIQLPIEFEGKAPTPKVLAEISQIAKEHSLHTIFVQPQFSTQSAETIAHSINGNIVVADPLAGDWEENLRTVSKKLATSFIRLN
ncbi:MAG: zinc ABC transporter substrate-binding protein [Desulfovibrionales bacterium]|nr:zinc ABC transporter substrate-binding protein [Desulfovibrionales bacterium]